MRVRRATQTDVETIASVHVATWRACYRNLIPEEFLARLSAQDREPGWRKLIDTAGRTIFVCRPQRQTVGFAACGPTRDVDKDAALVGELYAIYVLPDFWGEGCGHAMCKRVERVLTSTKFIEANLWVLDGNARARQFYEREGFRTILVRVKTHKAVV